MEDVSFPNIDEHELSFHNCFQDPNDIDHVTIMKVKTSLSGKQDCKQLGPCLQINSPLSTTQNNITDKIKSMIKY